jgi:hypothetical protein
MLIYAGDRLLSSTPFQSSSWGMVASSKRPPQLFSIVSNFEQSRLSRNDDIPLAIWMISASSDSQPYDRRDLAPLEGCQQIDGVPKSPLSRTAALVRSAGT